MGINARDFTRVELRLPDAQHAKLKKACRSARIPMNAVVVALVEAFLAGDFGIERRPYQHPYIAKPTTVRDVMNGKVKGRVKRPA